MWTGRAARSWLRPHRGAPAGSADAPPPVIRQPLDASPAVPTGRLVDIDWLRVLAITAIVVYHTGRFFDDLEPWHIKNDERLDWLTYPMAIGSQVVMPLFWVVSGIATRFALGVHPVGEFVRRRVLRLLVPVVLLGWFVLSPPQVFIEATTDQDYNAPPFQGSFAEFVPHYLTEGVYGWGGYFALTGMHLWYLVYLLVFTLLALPLFVWMRGDRGVRTTARLAGFLSGPVTLHLLVLPLLATEVFLPRGVPVLGWEEGGWRLASYLGLLVVGYLIGAELRLRAALERQRWYSLALAVVTLVPLALVAPVLVVAEFGSPTFIGLMSLRVLNGWFCVAAVLGFGARHLNVPGRVLAYAGQAVLPVYILHQPVVVVLGFFVRHWPLPAAAKYPLLLLTVLVVCLTLFEVIRRVGVLRFLFGMTGRARSREPRTR